MIIEYLEKDYFHAEFPFLKDFKIHAYVPRKEKKLMNIVVSYEKNNTLINYTRIACAHTLVCNISAEEYQYMKEHQKEKIEFVKEYAKEKKIISADALKYVTLSQKEHFNALKSYVEGIAITGIDIFSINEEELYNRAAPIIKPIFNFVVKYNPNYIDLFLKHVDTSCRNENGEIHLPSFISNYKIMTFKNHHNIKNIKNIKKIFNFAIKKKYQIEILFTIIDRMTNNNNINTKYKDEINAFLHSNIYKNFLRNGAYVEMKANCISTLISKSHDIKEIVYAFKSHNINIQKGLAKLSNIHEFVEVIPFFTIDNDEIKKILAINEKLCEYDEFAYLFASKNIQILNAIALNNNATKFKEYKLLFQNTLLFEKIAQNTCAQQKYPKEFKKLFNNTKKTIKLALVQNHKFAQIYPKEYFTYFNSFYSEVRNTFLMNPLSSYYTQFKKMLLDDNYRFNYLYFLINKSLEIDFIQQKFQIFQKKDFQKLFTIEKFKYYLMKSTYIAKEFDEFKQFFKCYNKQSIVQNPEATRFREFNMFFTEEYWSSYKEALQKNKKSKKMPLYTKMLQQEKTKEKLLIAQIKSTTNKEEFFKISRKNIYNKNIDIRIAIAENPLASQCKFEQLFFDKSSRVKTKIAANPQAIYMKEYHRLFYMKNKKIKIAILENTNLQNFKKKKEIKYFLNTLPQDLQIIAAKKRNLKSLEAFKVLRNHKNKKIAQIAQKTYKTL